MELIKKIQQSRFQTSAGKTKLYKQIGSMIRADKPIKVIFAYLLERVEKRNDALEKLGAEYAFLKSGDELIARGKNLSDCFKGWVNPTEFVILKTGEETGRFEEAFDQCIRLSEDVGKIRGGIKSAMIMPAIAFALALGILISARQKMIPMLADLVPMEKWKSLSLDFYAVTESVGGNPTKTVAIVVGSIIFLSWAIPNLQFKKAPAVRTALDRFPPFSYYKQIQISIFLRSLATLIESNVRLRECAEQLRENANPYLLPHMEEFERKVNTAKDESAIFKSPFLGELGEDLAVMSQGNNLEGALKDAAEVSMVSAIEVIPSRITLVAKLMIVMVVMLVIFGLLAFQDVISVLQSGG